MIKKILEKWKQEWWLKHASEMAKEYQIRESGLITSLEEEMKRNIEKAELERDILYAKVKGEIEKGKVLEEEVSYRSENLDGRRLELIQADNDLKEQIRILEAKSHPSNVWTEAFTLGVSKSWEMMLPIMTQNLDKVIAKIKEDSVKEAIGRLNVTNKK